MTVWTFLSVPTCFISWMLCVGITCRQGRKILHFSSCTTWFHVLSPLSCLSCHELSFPFPSSVILNAWHGVYFLTEILARHPSSLVPCTRRCLYTLFVENIPPRTDSCTVYHHLLWMIHLKIQCLYLPLSSSSTDKVPSHHLAPWIALWILCDRQYLLLLIVCGCNHWHYLIRLPIITYIIYIVSLTKLPIPS